MAAVAEAAVALDAALQGGAALRADPGNFCQTVIMQITGASAALGVCSELGAAWGLQRNEAFRIARGCQLVLRSGHAVLASLLELAQAAGEQRRHVAIAGLEECASTQADAVSLLIHLLVHEGLPAVAAALGEPQAVLAWLSTLSDALAIVYEQPVSLPAWLAGKYCNLAHTLLAADALQRYRDALTASPAAQRSVYSLLLRHCLPSLTAVLSSGNAGDAVSGGETGDWQLGSLNLFLASVNELCEMLFITSRTSTVKFWAPGPDGAAAVQYAAQAARAVPACAPPGTPADLLETAQNNVSQLLAALCPRSGGSGSYSGTPREWEEAAWQVLAVMPHLLTLVEAQAAGSGFISMALMTLPVLRDVGAISSHQQLVIWAAATVAVLRLLPRLAEAEASPGQLAAMQQVMAFWSTGTDLAMEWADTRLSLVSLPAQMLEQLLMLHGASCRLLHWAQEPAHLAQLPRPVPEAGEHSNASAWRPLPVGHTQVFSVVLTGLDSTEEEGAGSLVCCTQALLAAHYEALRTSLAAAGAQQPQPVDAGLCYQAQLAQAIASEMFQIAARCPYLVDAALLGLMQQALDLVDTQQCPHKFHVLFDLPMLATASPNTAAAVPASGLLDMLLRDAVLLGANGWAGQCLRLYIELIQALRRAATAACEASGSGGVAELAAARQRLTAAETAALSRTVRQMQPAQRVEVWRPLLQPAAELAAVLQQHWEQSGQQAAARLELAQAAATRSCAYLRCANLSLAGGPGAGQGKGSSKCSACRVCWYCNETCSHADWRGPGGHKRVCKALGELRRQEKAATAAAAQEQQQVGG